MEKRLLINLLKNPQLIDRVGLGDLFDLAEKYPHFKVLKMLIAKKAFNQNWEQSQKVIHKVATSVNNRSKLFKTIHTAQPFDYPPDNNQVLDDAFIPLPVPSGTEWKSPDELMGKNYRREVERDLTELRIQVEEIQQIKPNHTDEEVLEKVRVEVLKDLEHLKNTSAQFNEPKDYPMVEGEAEEINEELIESIKHKISQFNQERNLSPEEPNFEDLLEEEKDIKRILSTDENNIEEINEFLKETKLDQEEPDLDFDVEETAKKSATAELGDMTQTVAQLYEKQGNFKEAIRIYQELSLKYPQKSSYFAGRIEILKNKL